METPEIIALFDPSPKLTIDFSDVSWQNAVCHKIDREWNGQLAPAELHTTARVIWSGDEIVFGFECGYTELDIDEEYDLNRERHALWDRDVCEAFLRSPIEPHEMAYREFEVAPTGQWCDLLVDRIRMWHDWEWTSGMRTASEINPAEKVWRAVMAIPFDAFGCSPQPGDVWYGNLFRISKFQGARRYLAFSPTLTEEPNYHVPDRFIRFKFSTTP
jgi:hypothetical protein